MTCRTIENLTSAYLEGEVSADERMAVEAHLPQCRACASAVQDARRMLALLHGLPRVEAPASFTDDVMNRVREAVAEEAEVSLGWRRFLPDFAWPRLEWERWVWAPAAMAAGVLLTLGGIRVGLVPVAGLRPQPPAVASAPAVTPPAAREVAAIAPVRQQPQAPQTRQATRSADSTAPAPVVQVAAGNPLRGSQVTGGAVELTGHDLLDPTYGAQLDLVLDRVSLDGRPVSGDGAIQPVQHRRTERRLRTF